MIVRELIALFGFRVDEKSAGAVESRTKSLVAGLKGAAVVAAAGAAALILKSVTEGVAVLGDEIQAATQRIGVNAQALQELRFAGKLANVSSEELGFGLRVLSRNAFAAATGSEELQGHFRRLGVRVTDAGGKVKSAEQLITELGDGFQGLTSDTERVALAQSVLGRSGSNLLPLLIQGSSAIAEQRLEARKLGGILDQDLIRLSDEYSDELVRQAEVSQGVKNAIAKAILPSLIELMQRWRKFGGEGTAVAEAVGRAVNLLARVVAGVARFFLDAGEAVISFGQSLSPLTKRVLGVAAAIGVIAATLALPFGPLVLLSGLVAALIEDFQVWREGGVSVIGHLITRFNELVDRFPWLRAALTAAGEAFRSVFGVLRSTAATFMTFFTELFTVGPRNALDNLGTRLREIWGPVWEQLKGIAIDTWDTLWKELEGPVHRGIEFVRTELGKLVAWVKEHPILTAGIVVGGAKVIKGLVDLKGQFQDVAEVAGGVRTGIETAGGALGGLFGSGEAPAVAEARAAVASFNQRNEVTVNVTATGANDQVGDVVANRVEGVLERWTRDALGALAP